MDQLGEEYPETDEDILQAIFDVNGQDLAQTIIALREMGMISRTQISSGNYHPDDEVVGMELQGLVPSRPADPHSSAASSPRVRQQASGAATAICDDEEFGFDDDDLGEEFQYALTLSKIDVLETEKAALQARVNTLDGDRTNLGNKVNELETSKQSTLAKVQGLLQELKVAKKQNAMEHEAHSGATTAEVEQLREQIRAEQATVTQLQQQLATKAGSEEAMKAMAAEEINHQNELRRLREELQGAIHSKAEAEEALKLSQAEVAAAVETLQKGQAEASQAMDKHTDAIEQAVQRGKEEANAAAEGAAAIRKAEHDGQAKIMKVVVANYKREMKERKRLFNLLQELRGNFRVATLTLITHSFTHPHHPLIHTQATSECSAECAQ
jgi:hypothetical protein